MTSPATHPEPGPTPPDEDALARGIESLRPGLRAYVMSILPHCEACDDVVQETSLFLWDRRAEYDPATNLKAWAFKVAWFKAMAWRRDRQREKVVYFSDDTLHEIADAAAAVAQGADERLLALRSCLARLSAEEIQLLQFKYVEGGSLTGRARQLLQKPARIQKTISRLRLALRHCIESNLSHG